MIGDRLIARVTATWTVRIGLLVEAGLHLTLATARSAYLAGFALFAFGIHAMLWTIVSSSLRQRLTPPDMLGRIGSTNLFIAAGGNCAGAVLGGLVASRFGGHGAVLGWVRPRDSRLGGYLARVQPRRHGSGVCQAGPSRHRRTPVAHLTG